MNQGRPVSFSMLVHLLSSTSALKQPRHNRGLDVTSSIGPSSRLKPRSGNWIGGRDKEFWGFFTTASMILRLKPLTKKCREPSGTGLKTPPNPRATPIQVPRTGTQQKMHKMRESTVPMHRQEMNNLKGNIWAAHDERVKYISGWGFCIHSPLDTMPYGIKSLYF